MSDTATSKLQRLTGVEKGLLAMIILFAINFTSLVQGILGVEKLPDEIVLWLIPSLLLIFISISRGLRISRTQIILFAILLVGFVLSELSFVRGSNYQSNFTYVIGFFKFYSIYFVLRIMNKDIAITKFIVKYSQIFIAIIILYFYYDFFLNGGQKLASYSDDSRYWNEVGFHVNGLSYIAVFGIFTSIISSFYYNSSFRNTMIKILFFIGIIFLNSSRGAFVMAAIAVMIWLSVVLKKSSLSILVIVLVGASATFVLFYDEFTSLSENVTVIRRLVYNEGTGRISQSMANWINFLESPLIGKGQGLAGLSYNLNTTRSNVHFMQSLAAYGVFLSFLYFLFMFRFFTPQKTNIKEISYMSIVIFIITFTAYNWTLILPLSFIAFINYINKKYYVEH